MRKDGKWRKRGRGWKDGGGRRGKEEVSRGRDGGEEWKVGEREKEIKRTNYAPNSPSR